MRREVIDSGELALVPQAKLKEALRLLERNPEAGKPLTRELAGFRSIRIEGSENRLVYRLFNDVVEVLAIGRRRDSKVHVVAEKRL